MPLSGGSDGEPAGGGKPVEPARVPGGEELPASPSECPSPAFEPVEAASASPSDRPRDLNKTFFLCVFLGNFGVHRFYTGHIAAGAIQLLTCGGCFVWVAFDVVALASGTFRDSQGRLLTKRTPPAPRVNRHA